MSSDEPRDDLHAEPDERTAHDGAAESDTDGGTVPVAVSDDGEPTILDVLKDAHEAVGTMVAAIEAEATHEVDMDDLLLSARGLLASLDTGPACPMCQGSGTLDQEPAPDPRAERCSDCHGVGKVYTGSLVPESSVRPCGRCEGKGFTDRGTVTTLPVADYTAPPAPAGAQWYDEADPGTWHLPIDPAKRGLTVGG